LDLVMIVGEGVVQLRLHRGGMLPSLHKLLF
jgi:hypothetical protein